MHDRGLNSSDLYLEVTESAPAKDSDHIIEMLGKLRVLGYFIEIDDFGTGYSSLNMLQTMDFNVLKIDKGFLDSGIVVELCHTMTVGPVAGVAKPVVGLRGCQAATVLQTVG